MSITPKHSKEPIHQAFTSPEQMVEHADIAYQINKVKINAGEVDKGFDIQNAESVLAFDIGYTPLQNTVILKKIPKELKAEDNKLLIVDNSESSNKYFIIETGLSVVNLKRGDIVSLGNSPFTNDGKVRGVDRIFKGVSFIEVNFSDLGGIFVPRGDMVKREEEARIKYEELMKKGKVW